MQPFNIQITFKGETITLTILPSDDVFKIIYFGGIIGAVKKVDYDWVLVTAEELDAGDLPLFDYKQSVGETIAELELTLPVINQITGEIENQLY